jgi:predicted nucleic acid-binding Zn ribbon protein
VSEPRRPTPLADVLASYLKQSGFSKRLQQAGIIEAWAELVGPQIAAVTAPESVTPDGVLRVRVASAAWANELSLMSPRILARLNAGRQGRVKEIRWVPGVVRAEKRSEGEVPQGEGRSAKGETE